MYRVFYDRLTDDTDRQWLFELSTRCVQDHFKESFDVIFENMASGGPKSKVGTYCKSDEKMKVLAWIE